ncbi:MAG: methyltransferase domain-containing protein [Hyphomicrobium sp.]|uniref:class I SAM-dependent methyltransferase n=1 Tax=Hyphomicrobium sp. TaxID=82 RepID=UPI0022BE1669|nr:class I SAM-dependent methyltransferase [Hyphomicrobium sp.]MBZ0208956.1 methyltransferase domain-containing protein [Hyphomicrobium sp.]MCZ7594245.1 methyltransferase domain-containing protein [Hyphomicrobium sp.]
MRSNVIRRRNTMVLCAMAMAALATLAFIASGPSLLTVLLGFLLLGCLISMAWALWVGHQSRRAIDEAAVHTEGVTIGWAAPFYDALCSNLGIGQDFRLETLRLANIATGDRVLDVGCGTGLLTRLAAAAVGPSGHATGIDPSAAMIAAARQNAASEGSLATFRLAAIEALPYADASFDVVLSSFMLHHLPPEAKRTGVREVYRVLRDGGRLLAVDIDRPANALWWLLVWPLLFISSATSNLRGHVPVYLHEAGFAPVQALARKWGLVTSWSAVKPAIAGAAGG